ncbi:pseudouridine synthase DEG1 [Sugiyamaella lignohabitans]|uniref:Pseudouridine synthase DEG1 n=1 Tax=Sugiyamaella lignohabitans TaxID=796027 RepID=A0A161HLD6_9ASCO|nr:pseudouridine synthase DEG1 [Sugiyamaella lignohabitans]ANB14127.1 pseudouridine synthase DEG1 [Sugiyamaella lignohabitans]
MVQQLPPDYSNWTKDDLIKRIQSLESCLIPSDTKYNVASEDLTQSNGSVQKSSLSPSAESSTNLPPATSSPSIIASSSTSNESPKAPKQKKKKEMDFSKFTTRKVAIRFAYLGWNYNGLAIQATPDVPTVELEILKAFQRTRIVPSLDTADCDFSRCGRTDKGVSAMRQVISLRVRSVLSVEEQQDPANDSRELDYLRMLNSHLPNDIIAYEICLRPPPGFDARFSCTYRHYRYYFYPRPDLNIDRMQEAAKLFLGKHDFRNFCKVDASKQITNFEREMIQSSIERDVNNHENAYYFNLRGTAFLWHQVRSMMAVLFLVGQGLEAPSIVSDLLDITKMPRRPVYEMAADYPLVLYDCGFPNNMEWVSLKSQESLENLYNSAFNLKHEYWMKSCMAETLRDIVHTDAFGPAISEYRQQKKTRVNTGQGYGKPITNYRPVHKRELLETPEVVNARWREKKKKQT